MIDRIGRLSNKLYWVRIPMLVLGFSLSVLFVLAILEVEHFDSESYLIPSIVGSSWAWLCLFLTSSFTNVPPKPDQTSGFFRKLKTRFKRFFYHLLGLLFIGLSIAVIVISFRLMMIWLNKSI